MMDSDSIPGDAHVLDLGNGVGRKAETSALGREPVIGDQCRHGHRAILDREPGGLRLDEVAMLKRMDAAFDHAPDRRVRIDVRRHIGAGTGRLVHDGEDFLARVAKEMDRIGRRGAAAVRHDFHEVCPALDLFACGAAHFIDPISNAPEGSQSEAGLRRRPVVETSSIITVAAGLAQRLAGNDQARRRGSALRPPRAANHGRPRRHRARS